MSLNRSASTNRQTEWDIVLSLYENQDFPFQHHEPQGCQLERKKKEAC